MAKKKKKAKRKKRPVRRKKVRRAKKPVDSTDLVHRTRMRVIGIGGGGGSIVSEIAPQVNRVDFVAVNTDVQALKQTGRKVRTLAFGQSLTQGLGCGMDARLGQRAVRDDKQKIAKLFQGIDLCILVSSFGGGTGSGAAPEIAKIARDLKVMTFGIFTLPFKFEGGKKAQIARNSLKKITPYLNAVAIIPNENIFQIIDKNTPLKEAFSAINKRLAENLRGLCEMVYLPGLVNIDFADLKTILDGRGKLAYLNSAVSQGPNRVEEALKKALRSPLNEYSIKGAEKIVFNITASSDLGMKEVEQISQTIADFNRRAKIIFGVSQNSAYRNKIRIALLALGCGKEEKPKKQPKPKPKPQPKPKPKKKRRRKPKPKPRPRPKAKPKPKPRPKPKRRRRPKPKPKPQPKPKKKRAKKKKPAKKPVSVNVAVKEPSSEKPLLRRTALDLRKAVEETEEEILAEEKKWDLPAFLRRKPKETE